MTTTYCHVSAGTVDNRTIFDSAIPDDWPDHDNWIANEEAQIGWTYADGVFTAPPPPDPGPTPDAPPPTPFLYATAQFFIADSDISSMTISSRLSGAFRFDVGQYWVFFTDEQPDTQYLALAYDGGTVRSFVREEDKFTSYFIISTNDFSGNPADPDSINLEIKRVQ